MSKTGWRKVYHAPNNGHRFFLRLVNGEPETPRRIAIADNSGSTPDRTEDGILWLDLERKWVVGNDSFSMPVFKEGDRLEYWTGDSLDALFPLLTVLRSPEVLGEAALSITCEPALKGGTAAKAVLKCLAHNLDPND
jgi:hypothetical protein